MYRLLIVYQPGAKSIAQKIAEALQSMAQSQLSIGNVHAEYKKSSERYSGFSVTVQTNDLSQTSLLFQSKGAKVIQHVTFVRPCTIAVEHVPVGVK
jgi:hypothetical protein